MQAKINKLWLQTRITVSFWDAILAYLYAQLENYRLYVLPIEQLLYYQRYLFSGLELHVYVRYDWWVMAPNMHCNSFQYNTLCILTLITWKLQVIYECSTHQTAALLSNISIFCDRAKLEIQLESHGSKHTSQSLSGRPFMHAYKHTVKTTGRIRTFCISHKCFTIGDIPCMVQSCMRDSTTELQLQTCTDHSLMQHFVHILQAYTYIAIWCTTIHDSKTHVPYDCILHTKRQLCCQQCIVLKDQS